MANIIIPQIIVVDPTAAFPAAFAPGETLLMQRAPNGLVLAIYNYSGGAAPLPELAAVVGAASQFEVRALALLSSARVAKFGA